MKTSAASSNPNLPAPEPAPALRRRGLLAGVGAAGAALLAAKALPGAAPVAAAVAPVSAEPLVTAAGYQETPHVLHYYQTARA